MNRFYIAISLSTFLWASACSNNLLTPITVDTSHVDSDTTTSSGDDSNSHSTDSDTGYDSDTATETTSDTGPSLDSETDTYEYTEDANFSPIGFATVPALDVTELTGGAGGNTVTVVSADEMQNAINNKEDTPLTIYVNEELTNTDTLDRIRVQDVRDLSIVGIDTNGILNGIGIHVRDSANIIIQNLTIHHVVVGTGDGISVENTHHIWIDHCDLYNDRDGLAGYDGLLDIANGSDYATVSWNRFHENPKGLIVGNSDNNAETDADANHVTYHHNFISNVSPGGLSFRFGQSHTFNNFLVFTDSGSCIGISSRMGACVRVELNLFEGISEPLKTDQSGDTLETLGALDEVLNVFGSVPTPTLSPTCTLNVPYDYLHTVNATAFLPTHLQNNTGVGIVK